MKDLRLYSFVNYYLSDIQRGIQTAHLVSELSIRHSQRLEPYLAGVYSSWVTINKTIIVLNGGNSLQVQNIFDYLLNYCKIYPISKFNEDDQSLNGALTCCGIICPNTDILLESCDDKMIELGTFIRKFNLA
jgi:hypothetical protein